LVLPDVDKTPQAWKTKKCIQKIDRDFQSMQFFIAIHEQHLTNIDAISTHVLMKKCTPVLKS